MRAATEGSLPPVMPQGNLVEVLGREVRQGSPGELMVESTPSRQRRPPCKTNKEESDEAADAAALTYLLTPSCTTVCSVVDFVQNKKQDTGQNRTITGHLVLDISQSLSRALSEPHGPPKCYLWLTLRPLALHFIHILAKRTYKTIKFSQL